MDIRQIEEASGMPRANIRFYENEGLLNPQRRPNGYRDYSDEDVETLKKIKLLRRLGLSVDTIRLIQQGQESLSYALEQAEADLDEQEAESRRAKEVCHEMRRGYESYDALDAQQYLDRFEESPEPESAPAFMEQDELPAEGHPWRRFLARVIDLNLCNLLWVSFVTLVLRWNISSWGWFLTWLTGYFTYGLMIAIEPLLLSTLGTTPGKFILGIKVRDANGARLSYESALLRTIGVFFRGYGCGIPIYSIVRMIKCCIACSKNELMEWDSELTEGTCTVKDTNLLAPSASMLVFLLLVFAIIAVGLQAQMPRHRGEITAAEFVDNLNDLNRFLNIYEDRYFDDYGTLVDPRHVYSSTIYSPTSTYLGYGKGLTLSSDDSGMLSSVRMDTEYWDLKRMALVVRAFAGADPYYNCFSLPRSKLLEAIDDGVDFTKISVHRPYELTVTEGPFLMTITVEETVVPKEGGTKTHIVFILERID